MFVPFVWALALSLFGGVLSGSVRLRLTQVVGSDIEFGPSSVEFFGGLPYALPPLGSLRLQLPVATQHLNPGIFNATQARPTCLQIGGFTPVFGESEDCLTLNIFRPARTSASAKLPVLVWFNGGAFLAGDAGSTPGTGLVARSISRGTPVIVVTFNYRVGPLGFPQGGEAGKKGALNLGLYDQLAALQWIQANIAAFGGDARKVTVFGESAGATSIYIHLLGNSLQKLARAAILESVAFMQMWGPEKNEDNWATFVGHIPSCAPTVGTQRTVECVRKASTAEVEAAVRQSPGLGIVPPYQPAIDGPRGLLPQRPSTLTPKAKIPVIIGTNLDEGTMFTSPFISQEAEIQYSLVLGSTPSAASDAARDEFIQATLSKYPDDPTVGSPFNTGSETFGVSSVFKRYAAIMGDLLFESGRRAFSRQWAERGLDVYTYLFADGASEVVFPFPVLSTAMYGTVHTAEIPYIFNGAGLSTPVIDTLSRTMQDYWISFATTLNPNDNKGNSRPTWERYTRESPAVINFNSQAITVSPDTYREDGLEHFIKSNDVLHR